MKTAYWDFILWDLQEKSTRTDMIEKLEVEQLGECAFADNLMICVQHEQKLQ